MEKYFNCFEIQISLCSNFIYRPYSFHDTNQRDKKSEKKKMSVSEAVAGEGRRKTGDIDDRKFALVNGVHCIIEA